jgi:hypothetical protein
VTVRRHVHPRIGVGRQMHLMPISAGAEISSGGSAMSR